VELKMADRHGVEIDYCPQCRGVWLDRGELDKVIERSAAAAGFDRDENRPYRGDDDRYSYRPGRKKKSFLGEMFDFG
jgi:Zn-finger nucleic acid-binding protein